MMKKISVVSLCVLVLFALFWWLWLRRGAPPEDNRNSDVYGQSRQQKIPHGNWTGAAKGTQKILEPTQIEQLRGIANLANRPIEFYGQVVDQNNAPIPEVKVTLQIRIMKEAALGVIGDLFEDVVVTSGPNGRFTLNDTKGSVLTVKALEKAGYEPSRKSTNRSFRYWDNEDVRYKADGERPVIFHMWKSGSTELLLHADKFYSIVPDGRSYAIDLLQHKKIEGGQAGDFKVSIRRPSDVKIGEQYDWICTLDGIGGGVIASDDEQMFLAPENGYQQRYEIKIMASDSHWTEKETRQFYLKSRDGKVYARMEVEILSNYQNNAIFSVEYHANPNGSRNLEYDPLQGVAKSPAVLKP